MINKPKGTYDIYGEDSILYLYVEEVIKTYMKYNNVDFIRTPVFEATDLFFRGVGETTDIVNKETYTFLDRGDRSLTLKPEGTAGVARSLIENKFYGNRSDVLKYYYLDTMYRYERPQAGRFREFTQFGIEYYNSTDIVVDADVISVGYNLFKLLGFDNVEVHINTLGDKTSIENYKTALKDYLKPNIKKLCPDCQNRFNTNVLRVIDCKFDQDHEVLKNIPTTLDYLSNESKIDFENLKNILNSLEVNYVVNEKIVRGLDYYTGVVFEYLDEDGVVLGGGGRYNDLVETLGGPSVPGVGFALGIERIMQGIKVKNQLQLKNKAEVYIMAVSSEEKYHALRIATSLRLNSIVTELNINSNNLGKQFKYADELESRLLLILKEEEIANGKVTVKDNITKEETTVLEDDLIEYIINNL